MAGLLRGELYLQDHDGGQFRAGTGSRKPIARTIGAPNGIGPEIAAKPAAAMAGNPDIEVVLVGDEHVIRHYGERHATGTRLWSASNDLPAGDGVIRFHPVDALPP